MYKCKYFEIQELVPNDVLELLGEDICWGLFDPRLLLTIDMLREKFERPIMVNSTNLGLQERGFRVHNTTTGAEKSAHKEGKAVDFSVAGLSAQETRNYIYKLIQIQDPAVQFITEMEEDTESWVHISTRGQSKTFRKIGGK